MKHLMILALLHCSAYTLQAQSVQPVKAPSASVVVPNLSTGTINSSNLVSYTIPLTRTTHILSPEPILYVDISTPDVDGDLPEKSICRIKPKDSKMRAGASFTVTVVTRTMVCVFQLICGEPSRKEDQAYVIAIDPGQAVLLNRPAVTELDFHRLAILALTQKRKIHDLKSKEEGLRFWVNNIFICGDYLLFDIGLENRHQLPLDIDEMRFKLTDKNRLNAHVSQEQELKPIYRLCADEDAKVVSSWRNFYIFPKFSYPTEKKLTIELSEKQVSGRKISLDIDYRAVLASRHLL
jgi:conjugative transposon TraN protein